MKLLSKDSKFVSWFFPAFLLVTFQLTIHAQETKKYRIYFSDKPETSFNPFDYFDTKAIERRRLHHLPVYDWYDLPVNTEYLATVDCLSTALLMHSRWLNAAVVKASPQQIERIAALPFVREIEEAPCLNMAIAGNTPGDIPIDDDEHLLEKQTQRMGASLFAEQKLNGNGIRIAIFDVGFSGADVHPAFEHLRKAGRVLKTWDFVKNTENVYHGGWHGTAVWSCVGGRIKEQWSGLAWDSEFLLARTEIGNREPFSEEENWVAAAEWADKNGADIVNSSLGYTDKRYFPQEMNGKTAFVTRGANIAARKGMLIVNAAGNEGSDSWRIVGAPADADSVLSVGGMEPDGDYHIGFSSYGPTWDGRLKPNICGQGRVFCATDDATGIKEGTSFASPLVAGFAACAWQAKRSLTNMELFKALEKSGSMYPYFDYAHGYGMPSARRFLDDREAGEPTFTVEKDSSEPNHSSYPAYLVKVQQETRKPGLLEEKRVMYYEVINARGKIERYFAIHVNSMTPLTFSTFKYKPGEKIRISFEGYTQEITF